MTSDKGRPDAIRSCYATRPRKTAASQWRTLMFHLIECRTRNSSRSKKMFSIGETRPNCDANEPQEHAQGTKHPFSSFLWNAGFFFLHFPFAQFFYWFGAPPPPPTPSFTFLMVHPKVLLITVSDSQRLCG